MPSPLNLRTSANTLEQFLLLTESSSDVEEYLVPDKFLRLYWVMDIVQPQANGSCCFTKRLVCAAISRHYHLSILTF